MATALCESPVLAHAGDDGRVWRSGPAAGPGPTRMRPAAFVDSLPADAFVRVPALPGNDALILRLGARSLAWPRFRLEVGRPGGVCWPALERLGPAPVLAAAARVGYTSPAVGGWRPYAQADLLQAGLAEAVAAGDALAILAALRDHPAYPALAFVTPRRDVALGRLMAEIRDPRWFVDPDEPDLGRRLKKFLGLAEAGDRAGRGGRRALAVAAWKAPDAPRPTDAEIAANPGHFAWRRWLALGGPSEAADLGATRHFVAYLRLAWLDAVGARRARDGYPPQGPLVPAHFFADDPAAAAACGRHLSRP